MSDHWPDDGLLLAVMRPCPYLGLFLYLCRGYGLCLCLCPHSYLDHGLCRGLYRDPCLYLGRDLCHSLFLDRAAVASLHTLVIDGLQVACLALASFALSGGLHRDR